MGTDGEFGEQRRAFLKYIGSTAAAAATAGTATGAEPSDAGGDGESIRFEADPFAIGVASGDPLPESVVIWTRLVPEPLAPGGGMPDRPVQVRWRVARDRGMSDVVRRGTTRAVPELAHAVHVDADGLEPETEYFYRFEVPGAGVRSPVGRTKTAPAPGTTPEEFRFAFLSCQHYPSGYYTAYDHLAAEDLDLVIHLGDYIYEDSLSSALGRDHQPPRETRTLSDYRIRHAQYKSDPDLQAAHEGFPWVVTWDDHEVVNNYDDGGESSEPSEAFLERRAAAYQAYFEHMPLRPARLPSGPDLQLYRQFAFGDLVEFNVLDTRQYRDSQTDDVRKAKGRNRTILGDEQERWLVDGLEASDARWNVLAQQVPFCATDDNPAPGLENFGAGDKWDGYRADRDTLLGVMADEADLNPVVITGDVHQNFAYDIKADFADPDSATVGAEYVGTSATSFGQGTGAVSYGFERGGEPWQEFRNEDRGYVRCSVTPDRWRTDYRVVSTVERRDATVDTIATFVSEPDAPGATRTAPVLPTDDWMGAAAAGWPPVATDD